MALDVEHIVDGGGAQAETRTASPGRAVASRISLSAAAVYDVFNVQRHLISRWALRVFRAQAMLTWRHATVTA